MAKGIYPRSQKQIDWLKTVNIGRSPWNKGKKGVQFVSGKTKRLLSKIRKERPNKPWLGKKFSGDHRKKISETHKGEKHYAWIEDRTKIKGINERNNPEYKQWRLRVLNRDNYRCMICGEIKKGEMEADHIYFWVKYPQLRYMTENGQALCRECHRIKTNFELRKDTQVIFATFY